MKRVIAIDGPSGAGKSTVAKTLSGLLGFRYLDTGALYRAVGLALNRVGMKSDDPDEKIADALRNVSVFITGDSVVLDGTDVSRQIRSTEAGHYASVFSARKPVRDFLLPVQKEAAEEGDLVAEGRDMTTVVFPTAWRKFYIDASLDARAMRRYQQLRMNGVLISMERAREDVEERDRRDSSRDLAPLRVAEDAVYIDTSELTIEEVLKIMIEKVRQ